MFSKVVIASLLLVIAGLTFTLVTAQDRVLCFNESDALVSLTPSPTPLLPTPTLTPSPTATLFPTVTPRLTSTTVLLPTVTNTPFPPAVFTSVPAITQVDPRRTQETTTPVQGDVFPLSTQFALDQTRTPGFNASTALAQTAIAYGTTQENWTDTPTPSLVTFTVQVLVGIKTRNCGNGSFSVNCPTNPTSEWLKANTDYSVDTSKTWCARGVLSGIEYVFVLTNKGWAAWKYANNSNIYLEPNRTLTAC